VIFIKKYIILTLLLIFSYLMCFNIYQYKVNTENIEVLSKYGSRGQETRQIQTRLKNWGYYTGAIDGIYGSKTVEAVKYFQRKNGLRVDGIAGSQTLKALGISSTTCCRRP
jgi:N-acetylmuramoyl-L-alanine amidase